MSRFRKHRWPLFGLSVALISGVFVLIVVAGTKVEAVGPVTPTLAAVVGAETVPAGDPELAAYVRAARNAEDRGDPLLRCLSFPDWPGNAWPQGLAAAHCHLQFDPVPSLAEIEATLALGDLAALDARYQALLDAHFDAAAPSEAIHLALARFDASAEADAVSAHWLELAPASAFALAARASHLHALALHTLGPDEVAAAPADRAVAAQLAQAAIGYYGQALAAQPRLLPAHAAIAELGLLFEGTGDVAATLAAGDAVDPACLALARAHLAQLSPRHGGSHEAMRGYVTALRAAHPDRPLLELATADEAIDKGHAMLRFERFDEAQAELAPALAGTTEPEAFESAAIAAVRASTPDHDAALGLLLAASRYRPGCPRVRELRARLLMNAGERTLALAILNTAPPEPKIATGELLARVAPH